MTSKLTRWLKFEKEQNGIVPCNLACAYLNISRQQLYKWRKAGRIATIGTAGVNYYGMKSLRDMKWEQNAIRSAKAKLPDLFQKKHVDLDSSEF